MKVNSGKGFTLIELMIVLAVMGIIMAIATPFYQTFMTSRRLNGATRQIMADMMLARQKAVTLNQKVKIALMSNHVYEIWNDASGDGTVANNEGDDIVKDIQTEFKEVTLTASANPIFNSRGTASLGATFTVTNSLGSKYVVVALNGRVRISDTPP